MSKALSAVAILATLSASSLSAEELDEVLVRSVPYQATSESLSQGVSILSGYDLDRRLEGTIGESLSGLPGVTSSFFGPGASRPIVRGQSGDRVRILIGGIGSFDVSTVSPDHAVASDSLSVEKVEVIRGPSTLLYGPSAIGGVVNILDGRIPTRMPEKGFIGAARGFYASNADERAVAGSLTAVIGAAYAVHIDGSFRKTDNYRVPGRAFRYGAVMADKNEVANSGVESKAGSFGLSRIGGSGYLGASISLSGSNYGVPGEAPGNGGGAPEESGDEEAIRIDLKQKRVDLMGALDADFLVFEQVKLRFGWGDYEHKELEGDETGTVFTNTGWEGRLELIQDDSGALSGAMGFQIKMRDFAAIGEEAFTPPSQTTELGFFAAEEYELGQVLLQAGLRVDHVNVDPDVYAEGRSFDLIGLSTGTIWSVSSPMSLGLNLSRTERGPTAEELYSDGAHLATRTFELGDPGLGKEVSYNAEFGVHVHRERFSFEGHLYYTAYKDYIHQVDTGGVREGLPVRVYAQNDAVFWGFELETSYRLNDSLSVRAQLDRVRARLDDGGGRLPRIPPLSVTGGMDYATDRLNAGFEVVFHDDQSRVSSFEEPTGGYVFVNASLRWCPNGHWESVCLSLRAKNLFNAVGRNHVSFLTNAAPLPGRDIRIGLSLNF